MRRPLSLSVYALAAAALEPTIPGLLRARARRGKEDPARLAERLGRASLARPAGALVWLHAVSVGESLSLLPLIEAFAAERPDLAVLATTGTRTAAELLAGRLPPGALHQYAPVDTPAAAARFLDHWRPDAGVFVESELWPNLIQAAAARGARLALVSAGLSAASFNRWRRAPAAARAVLGAFDLVLARDESSAERLRRLGARVDGLADLKFGARALPCDDAERAALRAALGDRPIVLAASTHPGEENLMLDACADLIRGENPARLVIAPRHPARGPDVAAMAAGQGFKTVRRAGGDEVGDCEVYVADTLGEMGLWYRLARIAVIGGSLAPGVGGHNPLEAARLGCPFLAGPHVEKWPVYAEFLKAGAGECVLPGDLGAALASVLADPARSAAMAASARDFTAARDLAAREAIGRIVLMAPP